MNTVSSVSSSYADYLYGSSASNATTTVSQADSSTTSSTELSTMVSTAVTLSAQSALIAGLSDSDAATYSAVDLLNSFIAADGSEASTSTSATSESSDTTASDTSTSEDTTQTSSISTYA